MRCHLVGCGTLSQTQPATQSDTPSIAQTKYLLRQLSITLNDEEVIGVRRP